MTLISGTIPNLVNGISQQPASTRLASQCEAQLNALSSVASGVSKRPPTHYRAKVSDTSLEGAFVHTINRDSAERYEVVIHNGTLEVFRLDGTKVPVSFPSGTGYLESSDPASDFRAVSVVDYTFILNRSKVVRRSPAVISNPLEKAIIWIRQGAYSSTYTVTVAGVKAEFVTADASRPENAVTVRTDAIAGQLWTQLLNPLRDKGIVVQWFGSILYFSSPGSFSITYSDPIGDTAVKLCKGAVQSFSDLPSKAVGGFKVKVIGSNENPYDDYYVEYQADDSNPNGGVWIECAKPGEQYMMDGDTLPRALVRKADGTFSFEVPAWAERSAGSVDTVTFPSFVDSAIQDIFFHRNRLGFLAGENTILSRAGDFFNFFRKTALQVLDTDPIDVAVATGGGAATLSHAVAFNEGLLLFTDQAQFQFGKADLLTPKTASITLTTQFGCSRRAKPVGSGKNVYFTYTRGEFSSVREYYLDVDTRANDAADITAHVPRYVPRDVIKLAASPNEDIIVALSAYDPGALYVYRYYWQGSAKLQSAWSRWDLGSGARILSCEFIESSLWLVIVRDGATFLEEMRLDPGRADPGMTSEFHLDSRFTPAPAAADGSSTFTAPYLISDPSAYVCVVTQSGQGRRAGQVLPFTVTNGRTVSITGTPVGVVFGRTYAMRYRFSTLLIREEASGGGQRPVTDGRLQIRKVTVLHAQTGYYRVEVTPTARDTYTYVFAGRTLGAAASPVGALAVESGEFSFAVASKNDEVSVEIINDSFHASTFLGASWEGFYTARARRI